MEGERPLKATRSPIVFLLAALLAREAPAGPAPSPGPRVRALRVLILSTMLADAGLGEWGFSALVEADGHRLLFDTGQRPTTVLDNARELGVDLAGVREVVLSHNHWDHTGGLLALRRELRRRDGATLSRVHVGRGLFWSRPSAQGEKEENTMLALRPDFEATGGAFVEHDGPQPLLPGVWLTGPVPRPHPERNYPAGGLVRTPEGVVADTIPEDQSLVIDTDRGLVIVTGCGHAGIVNTIEYARHVVREAPVHAIIGGLHLFPLDDDRLSWTASMLKSFGTESLLGAHCTGIEAVYRIRALAGLGRSTAVVGAVGASFELGKGIDPRPLAR